MKNIKGIILTKNKKFLNDDGNVFHGMRKSDNGYTDFNEIYFSFIKKNHIKAWKIHKKMTLNIIVPVGSIHFNFIDLRENSETFKCRMELSLSVHNYIRVTIPPKICFGFKGKGEDINMLVNIADIIHDDNECENLEFNKYRFIDK